MLAEHSDEVVVSSSSRDGSEIALLVDKHNLVDQPGIVVKSSSQWEVEANVLKAVHWFQVSEEGFHVSKDLSNSLVALEDIGLFNRL